VGKLNDEKAFQMDSDQYARLTDRFVLLMVNEGGRCLEENVVASERDVDVGMVLGTGFAPFRGGLMAYGESRGWKDVVGTLEKLKEAHGEHFQPCPYLDERAAQAARPPEQLSITNV
jgi:3-hydroxyacyl-CoA dehydrogenase / enoyl-CoA hydratase / 3-hydroxybutyryl-CoA epimerase